MARVAVGAVVPAWAVMGLVLGSGPGLLTRSLGVEDRSLVAAVLELFLATSAVAQLGLRRWTVRRAAGTGAALLLGGLVALVGALLVTTYLTAGATSLAFGYASQVLGLVPAAGATAVLVAGAAAGARVLAGRSPLLPEVPCGPTAVPCP